MYVGYAFEISVGTNVACGRTLAFDIRIIKHEFFSGILFHVHQ